MKMNQVPAFLKDPFTKFSHKVDVYYIYKNTQTRQHIGFRSVMTLDGIDVMNAYADDGVLTLSGFKNNKGTNLHEQDFYISSYKRIGERMDDTYKGVEDWIKSEGINRKHVTNV